MKSLEAPESALGALNARQGPISDPKSKKIDVMENKRLTEINRGLLR
jgi:hypothetical protein